MDSLSTDADPGVFGPGRARVRQPTHSRSTDRAAALRTDVEGLRAVAILLVVAFHAGVSGIKGGFIGVDVFYVLSGYLITGMLVREILEKSKLSLVQFYARRMRRLLPASALVLLVTLIAGIVLFSPEELGFAAHGARASALYMSNAYFAHAAGDYFSPRVATNPLLHTWSLSVEEQFYVFWPLVILLCLQVCKSMRGLTLAIIGLTVASLAASILLMKQHSTFAFYMLPSRAWEFGIGALAVLVPRNPIAGSRVLSWLGFVLILASAVFISSAMAFPGWIALIPVVGTVLTLIGGAAQPWQGAGWLLSNPMMQWIGRHSYSWYLWHWPLLVIVAIVLPNTTVAGKLGAVTAALILAVFTHRFFENPIRFHPELVKRPVATLVAGGVIAALCVILATFALHFADRLGALPQIAALTRASHDITTMPRQKCVSEDDEEQLKTCTFGKISGTTTVVLFGDSHAIPWAEPMRRLADDRGWRLTTILKSGCSAADFSVEPNSTFAGECSRWRARAIANILETRPALVFVGSATNRLFRHADPARQASPAMVAAIERGTRGTLSSFSRAGIHVILIRDNPEFAFDVPSCLARSARHAWYAMGSCEMPIAAVLDPAVATAEKSGTAGLNNIRYVDFTNRYCLHGRCGGMNGGQVMYRDTDHFTSSFAASLSGALEPEVLAAIAQR
jgi:peptidoglycan/LPS O-acetylase OafA/YrhL